MARRMFHRLLAGDPLEPGSLGSLNENELRVLHERVARAHEVKLDVMIVERARRLLEAAQQRPTRSTRQTSDS